jgi:hypothetical protein
VNPGPRIPPFCLSTLHNIAANQKVKEPRVDQIKSDEHDSLCNTALVVTVLPGPEAASPPIGQKSTAIWQKYFPTSLKG